MAKNNNYDFVISGAGLVGAITSLQLSKIGYRCCLIEKTSISKDTSFNNFAPLSLNYRSFLILKNFGLWDDISKYSYAITNLNLKSFNSFNRLSFESKDIGIDALGFVVDRRMLLSTFTKYIADSSNIDILQDDYIDDITLQETNNLNIYSQLNSGHKIKSKFLIVSDGIDSRIKNILNIKSHAIDYSQISYVYNTDGSFKKNTAIQIFNKYGIFAGIPSTDNRFNLILSINKEFENMFSKNNKPDTDLLEKIFKGYASNFHNLDFVSKYPLVTSRAIDIVKDNILLLGNSSQLLHPVGAQGFNLALRNVEQLIKCMDEDSDFVNLSDSINTDRESIFSNVDFATNIFANTRTTSRIISLVACNLVKSSSFMHTKFLENILGINNHPYLSIGSK